MKNLYLLLALVLSASFSFAQITSPEIPVVLPPSPVAAQIAKYSLVGSSMSTGAANTHIDLHTYSTKNLTVPIGITYNSGGLKVDEVASRVGMGWMLDAGGVVSRTVYGAPDAGTLTTPPPGFPFSVSGSTLSSYMTSASGGADTQPDVFNFNFGAYSGRFIIIGSTIKKLEQNNLRISGNISIGFTIYTPDGVRYLFTKEEAGRSINSGNPGYKVTVPNSWYLTEIAHPEGDKIFFHYSECEFTYLASVNQTFTFLDGSEGDPSNTVPCTDHPFSQNATTMKIFGVYLSKISSNSRKAGIMKFNYIEREDIPDDYALFSIAVYDGTGDRFGSDTYIDTSAKKIITMEHIYPSGIAGNYGSGDATITKRLFLSELTIDDKVYQFYYKDLNSLPKRLSYSQDNYGFYNGKSNTTLIPRPAAAQYVSAFSTYGFGDRHPDWQYAVKGQLSRIVYPTGGYDSVEYEPNTIYSEDPPNCDDPDSITTIFIDGNSPGRPSSANYYTVPIHITCTQQISMTVGCAALNLCGGVPCYPNGYLASVYIMDSGVPWTSGATHLLDINGNSMEAVAGADKAAFVTLQPGDYQLCLRLQNDSHGYLSFSYNSSSAHSGNKEISGVRVSRITSYDSATGQSNIKKYTYDSLSNGHSTGVLLDKLPVYKNNYNAYHRITPFDLKTCHYTQFSSANYFESNATGHHVFYARVIESDGDTFANGATEHVFFTGYSGYSGGIIIGNPIPGAALSNLGMYSGTEQEQRIFKLVDTTQVTLMRTITTFVDDSRLYDEDEFYTVQADPGSDYNYQPANPNLNDFYGYNVASYSLYTHWMHPASTQVIQYDANGSNPVTTTTKYTYNNTGHQMVNVERKSTSTADSLFTTRLYPQDAISGLTSTAQTAKDTLVSRHIIAPSLSTVTTKGGTLVNKTIASYKVWGTGLVQPEIIQQQSATGPLEDQLVYTGYDTSGNILSLQMKDGPLIGYHWGYTNQFPVAECKNASETEFFYEGFEESGTSGLAHTGAYYHSGNYSLGFTLPNGRSYVYSYWSLQSGVWVYSGEIAYTAPLTISGSAIDDVRVYPVDSQIITYTYDPQAGVTSTIDTRGITKYFEYDSSRRLVIVRDDQGNVLKTFDYHYQN